MTSMKHLLATCNANLCGKRVKLARVEAGMKQSELSAELSVHLDMEMSQTSLSLIENGARFVKDFELVALAEVLDKHPMWLLFGDKVPAKYR